MIGQVHIGAARACRVISPTHCASTVTSRPQSTTSVCGGYRDDRGVPPAAAFKTSLDESLSSTTGVVAEEPAHARPYRPQGRPHPRAPTFGERDQRCALPGLSSRTSRSLHPRADTSRWLLSVVGKQIGAACRSAAPSVRRCCSTLAAGARSAAACTVCIKRSSRPTSAPTSECTGCWAVQPAICYPDAGHYAAPRPRNVGGCARCRSAMA
jgi:hypothetical protein